MSQQFTPADVAKYNGEKGIYIIVDSGVYNVTGNFLLSLLTPFVFSIITESRSDRKHRIPKRAPRRSQDPQARRRQGRQQAVLEIPQ